jgi:hypothetical protein
MRRALAVLFGLAVLTPLSSTAVVPDQPRYRTYVVCSAKKSADPATTCPSNKPKTAVFLSKDRDATYKICVKYPAGQRLCASQQFAKKGKKVGVSITSSTPGRHKVVWSVGGDKVGTYRFEVTA